MDKLVMADGGWWLDAEELHLIPQQLQDWGLPNVLFCVNFGKL